MSDFIVHNEFVRALNATRNEEVRLLKERNEELEEALHLLEIEYGLVCKELEQYEAQAASPR